MQLQSWIKVLRHFYICEAQGPFVPQSPTQESTLDACVQYFYRFSTLFQEGGGSTVRYFPKGSTVWWEQLENTDNLYYSPGL